MEHPANFLLGDAEGLVRCAMLLATEVFAEAMVACDCQFDPGWQTKIGLGVLFAPNPDPVVDPAIEEGAKPCNPDSNPAASP